MKPEKLIAPHFFWNERDVALKDRVWFIPDNPQSHDTQFVFPGWDHPDVFARSQPVHVEYCSGNGLWIAEKARENPQINWVAVEKKFMRVRKIWSKIKNYNLDNLLIICGEAYKVTHRFFPENSIAQFYINFPDPWPKRRHAKHRLIHHEFLAAMRKSSQKETKLHFVTDDPVYSEQFMRLLSKAEGYQTFCAEPGYLTELPGYGSSYFEELWRQKGKTIRYHLYEIQ